MKNEETDFLPRTKTFARRITRLYSALPKSDTAAQVLVRRVLRSGTSAGVNYREANRTRSRAEFISKMGDCLKEADELVAIFITIVNNGLRPFMRKIFILHSAFLISR